MIESKADLKKYMAEDMSFFHQYAKRDQLILRIVQDPAYQIVRYLRFLRKEEYYFNVRRDVLGKLMYFYYFRKKNVLGNKLGFKIPKNCFGPGLTIYHHGNIIVNEAARIGANCRLHGNNCIGNKGNVDFAPIVGNNLGLGFGACLIGGIVLADDITVGANAVVVKDSQESNIALVGVPARKLKV
jgi:serine O-acetyltransferase